MPSSSSSLPPAPLQGEETQPLLYRPITMLFTLSVHLFYNTISVNNFSNFPQTGPTILAFNHGNGLVDAALLMSTTSPRVLRFCAKDSLWDLPFWGWLVRNSGAVQVYRPKDHSKEKAAEYNEATFVKCYEALHRGECLGIAPEGVSRFAPNLAQPLKTGPVRIAMRALELHKDMPHVQICPVGITYTHREKFRSSVLLDFGEPVLVTRAHVDDGEGGEEQFHRTARVLTEELNSKLINELTIHSPSFAMSKLAMTATRMQLPFGTNLSLRKYFAEIQYWTKVLPEDHALVDALTSYQLLLDEKRVKDERVRRYAIDFEQKRPSSSPRVLLIAYRSVLFALLSLLSLPGVVLWSPVWLLIRRWERALLAKGPGWNDSVTEMKMQVGAVISVLMLVVFRTRSWKVFLFAMVNVRLFEEALACGRSLLSHFKFYYLFEDTLAELLRRRRLALTLMKQHRHLPREDSERTEIRVWPWENWSIFRRRKKDWNEILRLHDFNTMDYFE
ncbi:hypothetical protein BASA81_015064 [Batrachochytrium salamandrivorans]|nr:hypothetical protein BASA81_015064 [Batrachochytrium salamandrivorans]